MKMHCLAVFARWVGLAVLSILVVSPQTVGAAAQPNISSVRFDGKAILVNVSVPAGVHKITLESRSRLGAGAWVPRVVSRSDGNGSDLSFQLAQSAQSEILRVRADTSEPLPAAFYQGTNEFVSGTSTANPSGSVGGPVSAAAPGAGAGASSNSPTDSSRTVVESDIWNLSGNTLYFFNQYRGLQVIDLSVPDAPVVTGTYPLPNAGEQMYVLDDNHVALLVQDNCSSAVGGGSEVLVLDVSGGIPKAAANLRLPGWIQESRMVGTALYVASQAYQPMADNKSSWEWGSAVSSFDLSDPSNPAPKDTLWYSGYNNVVSATDQFLFIGVQLPDNWSRSALHCIDISAPDGSMKDLSTIMPYGYIPDKFKINQTGDVLSIISQNWSPVGSGGTVSMLETYSLADPQAPVKLGRLQFPQREQLHATRFDGNRAYIVTFYQMDPLWIVDLSDPTAPQITGQLDVPGWSTYIQPLGDRLVSIGINDTNDWRVAVSLFDVHDPAHPAVLSRVPLGVNNSWSEANNDEKAFAVLPDAGLILVPYEGYETNGYASRVQLIDLGTDSLKARGTIDHSFQPRRATLSNNRVYSISGKELLTVDATDRDNPLTRSDLEISWSVDRVFLAGDYVIEVANGNNWFGWWSQSSATPPSLRVSKMSAPDQVVASLVLSQTLPVIGATLQDGKLYVAQGLASGGYPLPLANGAGDSSSTNPPTLFLSVVDASQLPALSLSGQTQATTDALGWNPSLQPLWPQAGVLVWSGGGGGAIPYAMEGGVGVAGGVAGGVAMPIGIVGPWFYGNGGRLFAFDVQTPTAPAFLSELNLTTNSWWSFSQASTANGLVYLSHENSEFVPDVVLPGQPPSGPIVTTDPKTGEPVTNTPPVGIWVERYYLDVVDYADPKSPTVRTPVNIPGQLSAIGRAGALLYTQGPHWTNWVTDWSQWLDVSAYDGVSASLVASMALPTDWPHPLLINDPSIYIGRPDTTANTSQLETWTVADSGEFTQLGALGLGSTVNTLASYDQLLVAQFSDSMLLLDATKPAALATIGKGQIENCLWSDLTQADGSLTKGLWLPLGDFGLSSVPLSP
jgi:hypothetical protein